MSRSHLKASVLGGLIVFVWGLFSWMVFPWHQSTLKQFSNESEVAGAIQGSVMESGMYVLPNTFHYDDQTSQHHMKRSKEMMENGPFVFAAVSQYGMGKMSLRPFIVSLIIQIAGAFIVVWMLMQTKGLHFKQQVAFVTLFGLGVGVLGELPNWNWWGFSSSYVLACIVDLVIGWFLAGMAISKVIKK